MGDIGGLVEKVQELNLDQNKNLMKNLEQGVFTLRDMYEQFQTILNLGPISQVMGMMPGFTSDMFKGSEAESQNRIKRFMTIIESMSVGELDSPDAKVFSQLANEKGTHPRIVRIARGSGTSIPEVEMLLVQYKNFAAMVKKMGGKNGMFNPKGDLNKNMNPQNMAKMNQQIAKMIPPGMLKQMGGVSGLQNMVKQLQGGDMSKLMSEMGGMGGGGGRR